MQGAEFLLTSRSATQDVSNILWNLKVYYRVHTGLGIMVTIRDGSLEERELKCDKFRSD
jgi:hypothetical protein